MFISDVPNRLIFCSDLSTDNDFLLQNSLFVQAQSRNRYTQRALWILAGREDLPRQKAYYGLFNLRRRKKDDTILQEVRLKFDSKLVPASHVSADKTLIGSLQAKKADPSPPHVAAI